MGYFAKHGEQLLANGYVITPIKAGTKQPALPAWQTKRIDLDLQRRMAANGQAKAGVGILTGVGEHPLTLCDVDSTNEELVSAFAEVVSQMCGVTVERVGLKPKLGLVYRTDGKFQKVSSRVFVDSNGTKHQLEWLGRGQQFVAWGIHPVTGDPYRWTSWMGDLLDNEAAELPVVTLDQMEQLISAFEQLCEQHHLVPKHDGSERARPVEVATKPEGLSKEELADLLRYIDPDLPYDQWLRVMAAVHWETEGARDGMELVEEWSSRGVNYKEGEATRKWKTYKRAEGELVVGAGTLRHLAKAGGWEPPEQREPAFAVTEVSDHELAALQIPFLRTGGGAIKPTRDNLYMAMTNVIFAGCRVAFDRFEDQLMIDLGNGWEPFQDHHYFELALRLERRGFASIADSTLRGAVQYVGSMNWIDTGIEMAMALPAWDGKARVRSFLRDYCGAEDATTYPESVSEYIWTALAGRLLVPGIQVDSVPILMGEQGIMKSSGVRAMALAPKYVAQIHLGDKEDDINRKMRGKMIGELDELRGLNSKDADGIKSFVTQRTNSWVRKYTEFEHTYERRCVFIGTTNESEFLTDTTGNRRWMPVRVTRIDLAAIERDREQLWAEAIVLFREGGVRWREATEMASEEHGDYMVGDPWEAPVQEWLASSPVHGQPPNGDGDFRLHTILEEALGYRSKDMDRRAEMRLGRVLAKLGYVRTTARFTGKVCKVWRRK